MIHSREQLDDGDAAEWERCARRGDFASAWQASDRILQRHRAAPDFTRPRHLQSIWQGEPVLGKRVLVRCYHGLGDTIQFIRFVPRLAMVAREVIVWVQPPLIPLLQSLRGIDRLLPLHDGPPGVDYDVDVEVMELPFVLRATAETIPREMPYLSVGQSDLPGTRPRIGLAWRVSNWEHHRSIPFDVLRPLLALEGITWCSLQQGMRPDESHPALHDLSDGDLHDAARRVKGLDLVITADSMPAHLAGALGVPVWTLLLERADWRWMEERSDSPWYPTMRLFRQERQGNWPEVVARVRDLLQTDPAAQGFSPAHPGLTARRQAGWAPPG